MAAKTTTKVATQTGAAKDDFAAAAEGTGSYTLDVLANDPGSASLYSVAQVTTAGSTQFPVASSVTLASGASISIVAGKLVYTNANVQALAEGEVWTDTFTYTVRMANGALSTAKASVTVTGENDIATISGDTTGAMTEDDTSAQGSLRVSDADHDQSVFATNVTQDTSVGSFSFDAGNWTYTPGAAAQALRAGETVTETLAVASLDGSASETVTVTVTGVNDTATISGTATGAVTEDGDTQVTGGMLAVADVDHEENHFSDVGADALVGTYGTFSFDAGTGVWGYTLDNAAAQGLNRGDVAYDELVVSSFDGTANETIRVAIHGVDEPVALPPVVTPPAPVNDSVQHVVNQGTNVTNGRILVTGFDFNDTLKYTSQFTLKSYAPTDYGNDGVLDTAVSFSYKQNANSAASNVDVILVGYADLTAAQLVG